MQSVSSRFWTRVAVSISYDDNHYTTGTLQISYRKKPQKLSSISRSNLQSLFVYLGLEQGRMNGACKEIRTHSFIFASLDC